MVVHGTDAHRLEGAQLGHDQQSTCGPHVEHVGIAGAIEHRAWDVLDRVMRKEMSVGTLYDLWYETRFSLPELRRRLSDVDVAGLVPEFLTAYRAKGVRSDTADHVEAHVRALLPEGKSVPASQVTTDWLTQQLVRYPGRAGTRRKVHSLWSVFFTYCTRPKHIFAANPMDDVERPAPSKPPIRFYELADVKRIIDAAPTRDMAALWALMYGTGIEVSAALQLVRGDFDTMTWEVRAAGTKAHSRDRIALVAEWARPRLEQYLSDKLPAAQLWLGWNRWTPTHVHDATIRELKPPLPVIPLRNSRHHWAVRQARSGTPVAVIQAQLGHGSPMLTLGMYGRFLPQAEDRKAWERQASQRDDARRISTGR